MTQSGVGLQQGLSEKVFEVGSPACWTTEGKATSLLDCGRWRNGESIVSQCVGASFFHSGLCCRGLTSANELTSGVGRYLQSSQIECGLQSSQFGLKKLSDIKDLTCRYF